MKKSRWKLLMGGYLLTWLLIPKILLQNMSPTATLAWAWSILSFPFLGPIAYILFGSDRLIRSKMRRKRRERQNKPAGRVVLDDAASVLCEEMREPERRLIKMISSVNRYPTSTVREAQLLVDFHRFLPALEEAIDEAQDHVHIQFFIFRADVYGQRLVDALIRAQQRGVTTRLLLDRMGSFSVQKRFFFAYQNAGGELGWFRTMEPGRGRMGVHLRNHRKIQVIDGETGFVGGMNIGREYAGEDPSIGCWRDIQMRLDGDAVRYLQQTFIEDWYFATQKKVEGDRYFPAKSGGGIVTQVLIDGPDIRQDPIQLSMVCVLNEARERVWLTAGYFAPNEPLISALKIAAARGVDVRLLITEKGDHPTLVNIGRSYYEELLGYGVRIFEYGKGLNHAKVVLCDRDWVVVGSTNFDRRSMHLNFECNVLLRDLETATRLERALTADFEKECQEISLEKFRKRPFRQKALESLVRPLAPMV